MIRSDDDGIDQVQTEKRRVWSMKMVATTHPIIQDPPTHLLTHQTHSFTHSLTHLLTNPLIHSPSHLLIHPLTQSPTQSTTHSPTHPANGSLFRRCDNSTVALQSCGSTHDSTLRWRTWCSALLTAPRLCFLGPAPSYLGHTPSLGRGVGRSGAAS